MYLQDGHSHSPDLVSVKPAGTSEPAIRVDDWQQARQELEAALAQVHEASAALEAVESAREAGAGGAAAGDGEALRQAQAVLKEAVRRWRLAAEKVEALQEHT